MQEYRGHYSPLNCVSFCTWDSYKVFSTSHGGIVRCDDIVKHSFDLVSKNYLLFIFNYIN